MELETSVRVSATRIRFDYRLELDGRLLADGFTEHAFVRKGDLRPVSARRAFPNIYQAIVGLPPYSPAPD